MFNWKIFNYRENFVFLCDYYVDGTPSVYLKEEKRYLFSDLEWRKEIKMSILVNYEHKWKWTM